MSAIHINCYSFIACHRLSDDDSLAFSSLQLSGHHVARLVALVQCNVPSRPRVTQQNSASSVIDDCQLAWNPWWFCRTNPVRHLQQPFWSQNRRRPFLYGRWRW